MKIEVKDAKKFIYCITSMAGLINEARLKFAEKTISIAVMEPANVSMAVFEHKAVNVLGDDTPLELGINLSLLRNVLKRLDKEQTFEISVVVLPALKCLQVSQLTKHFQLPVLTDLDEREAKVPQLTADCEIKCKAKNFVDAILDCDVVAESVALEVKNANFVINAEGELAKAENRPECEMIRFGDNRSKYSLEYLKHFLNIFADNKELWQTDIIIKFKKDYPVELVMFDGELRWILAPRVEND